MIDPKQVGSVLRHVRAASGMTQLEAAALVGNSNSWMSRVESGDREPTVSELAQFVTALGGSVDVVIALKPGVSRIRIGSIESDDLALRAVELISRLTDQGRESFTIFLDLIEQTQTGSRANLGQKRA